MINEANSIDYYNLYKMIMETKKLYENTYKSLLVRGKEQLSRQR